jgi:hypothetical protein
MRWYQYGGFRRERPGVIILDSRSTAFAGLLPGQDKLLGHQPKTYSHRHTKTQRSGIGHGDLAPQCISTEQTQFPSRGREWARSGKAARRAGLGLIVRNKANCRRARGKASAWE